jgi:hypothetical protein
LPLLERVRVEAYVPDLPAAAYGNLPLSFEEEFTYAFGGCTIVRGLDGNYLSHAGAKTPTALTSSTQMCRSRCPPISRA